MAQDFVITLKDGIKLKGKILACMVVDVGPDSSDSNNVKVEIGNTPSKFYFIAEEMANDTKGKTIIEKGEIIELTKDLIIDNKNELPKIGSANFGNFIHKGTFSVDNVNQTGGNLFSKNKTSKRTHSKHKKSRKTHVK